MLPAKIYRGRQVGAASTGAEWWSENEAFARSFADELRGKKPGAGTATGEVVEDVLPTGDIRDIDAEVGSYARLSVLARRLGVSEAELRAAAAKDSTLSGIRPDDPIRIHVVLESPSVQDMLRAKGVVAVKAREISDKDGSTVATFLRLDRSTVQLPAAVPEAAAGPIVQAGFGGDMGPGQVARGAAERAPMAQAPLTEIAVSESERIAQAREHVPTHPVRSVDLKVGERFQEGDKWLTVTTVRPVDPRFPDRYSVVTDDGVRELGQNKIVRVRSDPAVAKQPWQMTRAEFQIAEYTPMVEAIQKAITEGKPIALRTHYRITPLRKPEHIYVDKRGDVRIPSGRKSVALLDDQVRSLAAQAGMPTPSFEERVYHHAAVEEAVAAGKPVPPEVLADYPDIAPAILETSKQREARIFKETEVKFAEEAASTETISEREARRAAEATREVVVDRPPPGGWTEADKVPRKLDPETERRLTELHSPQSIAASFARAGQEVAERDAAMRTLAAKLPDGTVISGWKKGTVPDGPVFWERGRRNSLDIHKEVGGRKLVKALGLPEDANANPKDYVNVAIVNPRPAPVAVTVTGPRLPLNTREIEAVGKSARLSEEVAARLELFKAAERDFRGSRRAIESRRKVRLD